MNLYLGNGGLILPDYTFYTVDSVEMKYTPTPAPPKGVGRGFQVKVLKSFQGVPFSLGSGLPSKLFKAFN